MCIDIQQEKEKADKFIDNWLACRVLYKIVIIDIGAASPPKSPEPERSPEIVL